MGKQSRNNMRVELRQYVGRLHVSYIGDIVAKEKGARNERRAVRLLKKIVAEPPYREIVSRIEQTRTCSPDDHLGKDILVHTPSGKAALQIKSSLKNAIRFREKNPDIPCVVVNRHTEESILIDRLVDALDTALDQLGVFEP